MTNVRITISYTASGSGASKLPAGWHWEREHAIGDSPLLFTDELQRVLKEDMEQVLEAIAKLDPRTKETEPIGHIRKINVQLNRAQRISAQAMHLSEPENVQKVLDHIGGTSLADISAYLYDYGDGWDLYQRLCEDCEITPRPELFHPNPED